MEDGAMFPPEQGEIVTAGAAGCTTISVANSQSPLVTRSADGPFTHPRSKTRFALLISAQRLCALVFTSACADAQMQPVRHRRSTSSAIRLVKPAANCSRALTAEQAMKTKATKRDQIQIPQGYMRIQLVTSYGNIVPLRKLDRKLYSEGEWTPFAVVLRKIG
jgi:hypothetical protein